MATYPDGTLLKASGPEVDRMEGGQRRWIPDPPTFTCMGLNWGAIQTIADSEWNQIPQGAPYPSRADGTLLQGSGPQVYVMTGCQRHWIPDPATFNAHGYNWSAIVHVSDADLTAIPEGAQLQSSAQNTLNQQILEMDQMLTQSWNLANAIRNEWMMSGIETQAQVLNPALAPPIVAKLSDQNGTFHEIQTILWYMNQQLQQLQQQMLETNRERLGLLLTQSIGWLTRYGTC